VIAQLGAIGTAVDPLNSAMHPGNFMMGLMLIIG
jgi:hypothetical protein